MDCRICGTTTKRFLDLGKQPTANNFIKDNTLFSEERFYHLEVYFYPECYSVQLGKCPEPDEVFNKYYPFFTSSSKFMRDHFEALANWIKLNVLAVREGFIVEIGSNDGTFLKHFKNGKHLGIEPSKSVNDKANDQGIYTWRTFFGEECAKKILDSNGQADVIVSTNTFPHVLRRIGMLQGIKKLLSPSGIWINEEAYLGSIMSRVEYDQFYNEHVFYSSIASYAKIMEMFGLEIINLGFQDVHGGSIRYYITHASGKRSKQKERDFIATRIKEEGLNNFEKFRLFEEKVKFSVHGLMYKLRELKRKKELIVGYGATAKSATILNYCEIDSTLIESIYDTSPMKWGTYSPGMHIPIVSYDKFEEDAPKNVVLFAWNHATEIYGKEKDKKINWIIPI